MVPSLLLLCPSCDNHACAFIDACQNTCHAPSLAMVWILSTTPLCHSEPTLLHPHRPPISGTPPLIDWSCLNASPRVTSTPSLPQLHLTQTPTQHSSYHAASHLHTRHALSSRNLFSPSHLPNLRWAAQCARSSTSRPASAVTRLVPSSGKLPTQRTTAHTQGGRL